MTTMALLASASQLPPPPPATNGTKKPSASPSKAAKKAARRQQLQQQQQQSPPSSLAKSPSSPPSATTATVVDASPPRKSAVALPPSPQTTKKHATRTQSFKLVREKERKEKLLQATTACDDRTAGSNLAQDGLKSRNHKLVLAPTRRAMPSPANPTAASGSSASAFATRASSPASGARVSSTSWARDHAPSSRPRPRTVAEHLHEEILEYAAYTRSTVDAMTVHIEQMIAHVRDCVLALWPSARIEPFGSYSTGIWLPSSDVDLVILGVVEIHDRQLTIKRLRQVAAALASQSWVESIVVLDTAKIPVLKLVTAESSVPIDITFESTATHSGLLARDLIKRYADEMPELYPLAVIFKQLLRERDLNDAYTGGLSSYSIVLMLIHFQLLWRHGASCFKAAALFAAGATLPRPAELVAEEARERALEAAADADAARRQDKAQATEPEKTSSSAPPAMTSSFAAVVTRAKSLKRPASEAGKSAAGAPESVASSTKQPFSYAAVAAGIAKRSEDPSPTIPPAPVSYAAAVIAPASAATTTTRKPRSAASCPIKAPAAATPTTTAASVTGATSSALDVVSVTSSNADTEDSSSCSESTSTLTHDEEEENEADPSKSSLSGATTGGGASSSGRAVVSLGEHTMRILEFYGILFDYRRNGLSVRDGGYIYRLAEPVGGAELAAKLVPALVIEDPIHPDRNVSASSFAFSKVVAVFEDAYYALKYFRPSRFTPSALSCLLSTSGHTSHALVVGSGTVTATPAL